MIFILMALGKCFIKVHYNNVIRSALIGLPLSVHSESMCRQGLKTNMNGLGLLITKENIKVKQRTRWDKKKKHILRQTEMYYSLTNIL